MRSCSVAALATRPFGVRGLLSGGGFVADDSMCVNRDLGRPTDDLRNAPLLVCSERYKRIVLTLRKAHAELDCRCPMVGYWGCICHARHGDAWQDACDGRKSAVTETGEYVISYEFEPGRFLSVYFAHDGWSDADFMQALRNGAYDDILRAQTAPLERLRAVVALDVDEWQIGREIERAYGAWKLKPRVHVWRRTGETEWCSHGERDDTPTREQLRNGTIEPYRDAVSSLIDDMGLTWAAQTTPWDLGKLQSARGSKRAFDSADLEMHPGEKDGDIAQRLFVELGTPATRRLRDKQLTLPSSRRGR